jgi:NADPH-ferrihemoprotein reductase
VLGDKFELVVAFSRQGTKKVYVQQKLQERSKEINELLQQKAYFYVCGDAANMAREVNAILAQILVEQRGITETKAEDIVKNMRAANQYQVCHMRISRVFIRPNSLHQPSWMQCSHG